MKCAYRLIASLIVVCGLVSEGAAASPGVRDSAKTTGRQAPKKTLLRALKGARSLPVDLPDAGEHALLIDHREDAYAVFQFIRSEDVAKLQVKVRGMKRVALVDVDAFLKAPYAYLRPLTRYPQYAGSPPPSVLITSLFRDRMPMGVAFTGQLLVTATDYRHAKVKYQEFAKDPAAFRVKHPTRALKVNSPPPVVMVDARREVATVYVGLSAAQAKGVKEGPGVKLVPRASFAANPSAYIPKRRQDTFKADDAFARRVWYRVQYLRAGDSMATSWAGVFLYSSRDIKAAKAAKRVVDAKSASRADAKASAAGDAKRAPAAR